MNIIHFLSDCNIVIKSVLKTCDKKILYYTISEFIKSMFEYVFDYRFLIMTSDYLYNKFLIHRLSNMYDLNMIEKNNYNDIEKIELRIQRRIPALIAFRYLNFNNHISRVFNNLHLKIEIIKFL
jgi:hypothetical protein